MSKSKKSRQFLFSLKKHYKFVMLFGVLLSFYTTKAYALDIKIEDVTITDKSDTLTTNTLNFDDTNITSNITFNKVNDYIIYEIKLKNNESDNYTIESITDNNTNNNLKLEYEKDSKFNANSNTTIKVKMTYKNKLINQEQISLNDLMITLNLVKEDGTKESIVINNPTTGDNLLHYLVLLIITLTSLIFIKTKKKLKEFKIGNLLLLLCLLSLPFVTFAVERYKFNFVFSDIVVKGEFENYNITLIDKDTEETIVRKYGEPIGTLPTGTKDGYEFLGWYDIYGNEVNENTIITGPMTIETKYKAITYNITYDLDGGTVTNPSTYTVEDEITLNNPIKQGYTFSGWTGSNGTSLQTRVTIEKGTTGDLNYKANYSENGDTPYTVIHRYQKLDLNSYDEETENLNGSTNSTVTPALKPKTGFDSPEEQDLTIKADGTSTLTYTYTRKILTLNYFDNTYIDDGSTSIGEYPYGTLVTAIAKDKDGYTFTGWSNGESSQTYNFNISENITLEPIYTPKTDTPYKVVHKTMDLDGINYTEKETENLKGTTDSTITPSVKSYTGFTAPSTQTVTIKADGTTEVEYLYTRNKYTLTLTDSDYIETTSPSDDYYYDTEITLKALDKTGYTFSGWSNGKTEKEIIFKIEEDIEIGPQYTPNGNTPYKVIHKTMNLDGETYKVEETKNLSGETNSSVTPSVKSYTGFTAPSTQTVTIKADGTTEVEYLYTRNKYTLTLTDSDYIETTSPSNDYYYGTEITLKALDKTGYTFTKWSNDNTNKEITFNLENNTEIGPNYTPITFKVSFDSNGGTGTMDEEEFTYDTLKKLTKNTFTRDGYTFTGWNENSSSTVNEYLDEAEVKNLTTENNKTITLYAIWEAREDTPYKVIHKTMDLDGINYTVAETESLTGTSDTYVTPDFKSYEHFSNPINKKTEKINPDGSTVIEYLYTRDKYILTLENTDYIDIAQSSNSGEHYYGETITLVAIDCNGKTFSKWSNDSEDREISFVISSDITIGPIMINDLPTGLTVGSTVSYAPEGTYLWQRKYAARKTGGSGMSPVDITLSSAKDGGTFHIDSWKVLDIDEETGNVTLIASQVSSGELQLDGAQGYNNGVKIMNDACNSLYGNSQYGIVGRSINLQDYTSRMSTVYKYNQYMTQNLYETYKNYPTIYALEKNSVIDGNENTTGIDVSDSPKNESGETIFIDRGDKTDGFEVATTSIYPYNTKYDTYRNIANAHLKNYLPDGYYDLLMPDTSGSSNYWVATRFMESLSTTDKASFSLCAKNNGNIEGIGMYNSQGAQYSAGRKLLPIVTLNGNLIQEVSGEYKVVLE